MRWTVCVNVEAALYSHCGLGLVMQLMKCILATNPGTDILKYIDPAAMVMVVYHCS